VVIGGAVNTAVTIPGAVALAGQSFREQVVSLELDALGNVPSATSTDALVLTIGVF
jgi:hypothetical protein